MVSRVSDIVARVAAQDESAKPRRVTAAALSELHGAHVQVWSDFRDVEGRYADGGDAAYQLERLAESLRAEDRALEAAGVRSRNGDWCLDVAEERVMEEFHAEEVASGVLAMYHPDREH